MEIEVFDGVAAIAIGDTLLTLWQAPARSARIRRVTELTAALLERTPGTIVAGQFLLPSASPPRLRERADISAGLDVVLPRARRLVTTPLGDAAWQSVVRTVMRAGIAVIGKAKLVKVAADPASAFDLIGQVASDASPDRASLERALDALHGALGVPRPSS